VQMVTREQFMPTAISSFRTVHTVLDIGSGIKPQDLVDCRVHVCVEPFRQYAERLTVENPDAVVITCGWSDAVHLFPAGSVDTVVLLDVIEHLEKDEGQRLLEATVKIARSQVIVLTPLGFMPQGEGESKDAWGLDGTDWQVHRSGWVPEDFPGWQSIVCEDFHEEDAYGRPLGEPHGALFAILDKGAGLEPGIMVRYVHWQRRTDSPVAKLAVRAISAVSVGIATLLRGIARR